jgi:hypothetical protein
VLVTSPGRALTEVSQARRPYRTWAAVHLRALSEQRTGEIVGRWATRPAQARSATTP